MATQLLNMHLVDTLHGSLDELRKEAQEIQSEWDGDEPGELEDRADEAKYLIQTIDELKASMEQLLL